MHFLSKLHGLYSHVRAPFWLRIQPLTQLFHHGEIADFRLSQFIRLNSGPKRWCRGSRPPTVHKCETTFARLPLRGIPCTHCAYTLFSHMCYNRYPPTCGLKYIVQYSTACLTVWSCMPPPQWPQFKRSSVYARTSVEAKSQVLDWRIKSTLAQGWVAAHGTCAGVDISQLRHRVPYTMFFFGFGLRLTSTNIKSHITLETVPLREPHTTFPTIYTNMKKRITKMCQNLRTL